MVFESVVRLSVVSSLQSHCYSSRDPPFSNPLVTSLACVSWLESEAVHLRFEVVQRRIGGA